MALRDSDYVGYAAGSLVVLGAMTLLLFLGPIGWILAFLLLCSAVALADLSGVFGSGAPAEEKVNCPSCGARVAAGRDECTYCGDPLSTGSGD